MPPRAQPFIIWESPRVGDRREAEEGDPAVTHVTIVEAARAAANRIREVDEDAIPDVDDVVEEDDDEHDTISTITDLDEYIADEEDDDGDDLLPALAVKPLVHPPFNHPPPPPPPPIPRNPKFWTKSGNFIPVPGLMAPEEEELRKEWAKWDLHRHNVTYILELCKSIRSGVECKIADTEINVGCRNYIVELEFEDGVRWLLKVQQPRHKWSE